MKRKILIIILLPLLLCSFLSVGYSQLTDTSIISMSGTDWSLKVDSALASSIDSRNTPYMTSKSATEKELFLELATLEDCKSGVVQFKIDMAGLTAYKQLPLTQEEIDSGSFRPKNVENSFALFDDSGKKVAHIYGSKITDSKGVEVWLDQDLQDGLLTVILPKPEVLETLSFPLLLDPTFGYTSVGASTDTTNANRVEVFGYWSIAEDVNVSALNIYLSYAATQNMTAVIYNSTSSPSVLMGSVERLNVSASAEWVSFNFTSGLELSTGDYWIGLHTNGDYEWKYDSGIKSRVMKAYSYSSGNLDPFGTPDYTVSSRYDSIYVDYTEIVSPTPTPTPFVSATPFPEGAMDDTDWWISILVLLLIIINIFLMMLPFALVRFTFGILSLFLCMLALSYQIPLSPYLQTAGLLISALAMLFSVRARE